MAFVHKSGDLLADQGGLVIIKGVIPDEAEREIFKRGGFTLVHANNDGETAWSVFYKSTINRPFNLDDFPDNIKKLVAATGYNPMSKPPKP